MMEYARVYYFYNSALAKIFRICIFVFLAWFIVNGISNGLFPKIPIFLFSIFLMFEFFFHFKIGKIKPLDINSTDSGQARMTEAETASSIFESFTLAAIRVFFAKKSISEKLKHLLGQKSVHFILSKMDATEKDISAIEVSLEELGNLAFDTAKKVNGKFVTNMDIFVSYLLLTEAKTKLLFNKNLKYEELLDILYWARKANFLEEHPNTYNFTFWGEGIGEDWVFGWAIETKKYMVDLTKDALKKKPMLLGRQEEYKEAIEGLYKNRSVLLIGEPGSGKTSLIEALAYESMAGNLKGNLYHQRFFQILVDSLIAGSQNQGELQGRIDSIIEEIIHANNVIIFIPDLENILGSSTFNLDLSGLLIPYLKRGNIRIIATIIPSSYKKFVEPKQTLLDVLEVIKFDEPNKETSFQMLLEKTLEIEKKNNVSISYRATVAALNLAEKYLQNRVKPGSCVKLLEDTATEVVLNGKKIVEEQDVIEKVESKTKILVNMPSGKEKELLLHLEDEMHKYIVNQKGAIFAVSEGMRRLRSGLSTNKKPISFLFLGPTGVGKTATAKTLASLYFGENKMIRLDMSEYGLDEGARRLLGGFPDEEGLTDKVYNQPFSLILLDEFEKAASSIQDLFLQVLDDGRLTDNKGRTVSFINTIILVTSNAASELIREEVKRGATVDKGFKVRLLDFLQEKGIFKPELLNRFDDIIVFKPLGTSEINKITKLMLDKLSKKLLEKDIVVNFDDKIIAKIVKEGFDEQFGARPIRRFIQDSIEDLIAKKMLKDEIKRGNKILFSTDDANTITIAVS